MKYFVYPLSVLFCLSIATTQALGNELVKSQDPFYLELSAGQYHSTGTGVPVDSSSMMMNVGFPFHTYFSGDVFYIRGSEEEYSSPRYAIYGYDGTHRHQALGSGIRFTYPASERFSISLRTGLAYYSLRSTITHPTPEPSSEPPFPLYNPYSGLDTSFNYDMDELGYYAGLSSELKINSSFKLGLVYLRANAEGERRNDLFLGSLRYLFSQEYTMLTLQYIPFKK